MISMNQQQNSQSLATAPEIPSTHLNYYDPRNYTNTEYNTMNVPPNQSLPPLSHLLPANKSTNEVMLYSTTSPTQQTHYVPTQSMPTSSHHSIQTDLSVFPQSVPINYRNSQFYHLPSPPTSVILSSTTHDNSFHPYYSQHFDPNQQPQKVYSFVPLPGVNQKKRPRRKFHEVERLYQCNYPNCTKAYGTLNHLNAHVSMQKHGIKRQPSEFKELRKLWRKQKRETKQLLKQQQQEEQEEDLNHSPLIQDTLNNNLYLHNPPSIVSHQPPPLPLPPPPPPQHWIKSNHYLPGFMSHGY